MSYLFVPVILFLGIVVSYDDWATGKIRNFWILVGFGSGILLIMAYAFLDDRFNATLTLANVLCTAGLAYALWHHGLWSAGDAKLVTVFSFLVPTPFYARITAKYFPALDLVINMFFPAFALVAALTLLRSLRTHAGLHGRIAALREQMTRRASNAPALLLGATTLFTARQILNTLLGAYLDRATIYLFVLLFFRPLFVFAGKRAVQWASLLALASYAAVRMIQDPQTAVGEVMGILKNSLAMMIIMWLVLGLVKSLSKETDSRTTCVGRLEVGNVLTDETAKALREKTQIEKLYPDGLTREDVDVIRTHYGREVELRISRTIPFAPLAFSGVILTLILGTSLPHYVRSLIAGWGGGSASP